VTVKLREFNTASGHRFGHATLASPVTLNALSLAMIDQLAPQLDAWIADPAIAGIVLDAEGDKAFCAGGDVQALYRSMRDTEPGRVPRDAAAFFEREYRLDHRIHTCPKPILCWGHGIVMGGGLGLMAGASHRVATPGTRIAMPEISIGLYPDVGGSWFLPRMPGRTGLFLALTGASMNAADARFAGLADAVLPHALKDTVLQAIATARWQDDAPGNREHLTRLLMQFPAEAGESALRRHVDLIDGLMADDGLDAIATRLRGLADHTDAWLSTAGRTFAKGSPTSAALSHRLWQAARHLSLAQVLRLEYQVSLGCCMHHDFAEGVRALLIDKDRKPAWTPATLSEMTRQHIDAHFAERHDGLHPLHDLH
jgi:enoyl-CoA hydratase/carnithine racemase